MCDSSTNCQTIQIVGSSPDPDAVAYMRIIVFLSKESFRLTAPLYTLLIALGIFRRYIIARI